MCLVLLLNANASNYLVVVFFLCLIVRSLSNWLWKNNIYFLFFCVDWLVIVYIVQYFNWTKPIVYLRFWPFFRVCHRKLSCILLLIIVQLLSYATHSTIASFVLFFYTLRDNQKGEKHSLLGGCFTLSFGIFQAYCDTYSWFIIIFYRKSMQLYINTI